MINTNKGLKGVKHVKKIIEMKIIYIPVPEGCNQQKKYNKWRTI